MRQSRLSGSVEGVMGNHDSYSDSWVWENSHCRWLSFRGLGQTRLIEKLWSNHGPPIVASRYFTSFSEPPASRIFNQLPLARVLSRRKRGFESLRGRQLIQVLPRNFLRIYLHCTDYRFSFIIARNRLPQLSKTSICDHECSWVLQHLCRLKAMPY